MADLKARITGYEYIPFLSSDEEVFSGIMPNEVLSNVPGINMVPPENTFNWALILKDASVAKKISSDSWARYFINAIKDYKKLDQIGEGEMEMLGLKIDMEKGISKEGYPDSIGKSYFDLELMDTGSTIRVYDDNTVSVWFKEGFRRLKIEQLEANTANTGPLETDGGKGAGADLTTILMRDYLDKIGFFDKFTVGQDTEEVFGVKGTVKDNGVAWDGRYVTIEYKAEIGKGSGIKEVRIAADGVTVNGRPIVDVVIGEDGAVYILYRHGNEVFPTPITLPDTILTQGRPKEADSLTTKLDYYDIQGKTGATDLFGELDIENSNDFTRRVAYAAQVNMKAFDAEYGEGKWKALMDATDQIAKVATDKAFEDLGLNVKTTVKAGETNMPGADIEGKTNDGTILNVDIEFAGSGNDRYSNHIYSLRQKFTQGKADLGIIFWEGEYHVFINPATDYEPLANIAKDITRAVSRSIKDFVGIS